jgi:hypothetical protein
MKALPISSDKVAISLSMLCMVHCLAFPLLLALLPSIALLPFDKEYFHILMVAAVIPISIYALTLGCKKHKNFSIVTLGALGLLCLVSAVLLGENRIGEIGEKLLTVIGGILIALSHYKNFRLCQHHESCPCPSEKNN